MAIDQYESELIRVKQRLAVLAQKEEEITGMQEKMKQMDQLSIEKECRVQEAEKAVDHLLQRQVS